ncbi:hypothetical protein FRC00_001919 [Tulasnella sp. 408]|nr:hypothetical protein FRC00_001919 [Tulasnella sp. 408]
MAGALQRMYASKPQRKSNAKEITFVQRLVAWRKRIVALLSRAYAGIPAAQASALLDLPVDKIASEVASWKYDAASATFTPVGDAVATSGEDAFSTLASSLL